MYQISFAKILIIQAADSQIFMQSIADLIIFYEWIGAQTNTCNDFLRYSLKERQQPVHNRTGCADGMS